MNVAGWALAAALLFIVPARASAIDDGNAGLSALNGGDFDTAIRLFTRALNSGQLRGDDKEFAYANRGRAYFKKGDFSHAIVDLDTARRMKPDDADAQSDLFAVLATRLPADSIPGRRKPGFFGQLGRAILQGAAAGLAAGAQDSGGQ